MDEIRTSQGRIEAGYGFGVMKFVHFGDHLFHTKDFCDMFGKIAQQPNLLEGKLLSYPREAAFDALEEMHQKIPSAVKKRKKIKAPEDPAEWALGLAKGVDEETSKLKTLSLEEELKGAYSGDVVPCTIKPNYCAISIGKYDATSDDFAWFLRYVLNGGVFGWGEGVLPKFSTDALSAIRRSQHPFFKNYRRLYR